jgi:hypothetical protein
MDRLGAGPPRDLDDRVAAKVALGCRRPAERVGLVGVRDVAGTAIGIGIDGHRADLELPQRPEDA